MITKWNVFNFKSISKETELQIAPLTIFAGANSSGKSTLLQSMLVVAQTLANKVSSRSVVLNGALTKLGQFDDIRAAESESGQIVIGWACKPTRDPRVSGVRVDSSRRARAFYGGPWHAISSVSCEIGFDAEESGVQRDVAQIQPPLFSSVISVIMRDPDGSDRPYSITLRRSTTADATSKHKWIEASDSEDNLVRSSLQYEVALDDESLAQIREDLVSAECIGCALRHFLPEKLALGVDLVPETARLIVSALSGDTHRPVPRRSPIYRDVIVPSSVLDYILRIAENAKALEFHELLENRIRQTTLFSESRVQLDGLLDIWRRIPPQTRMEIRRQISEDASFDSLVNTAVRDERGEDLDVVLYRPPSGIADACWYIDHFFATSVRYLGPLRDEPKPLYPLAPTADPSDVGLKGEYTAAVLELHKSRAVNYIPTSAFAGDEITPRPITRTLEAAVIDWLQYLGVADSIQSRDKGKFGHELVVKIGEGKGHHDLTHVGVGVSQILPILVTSLLAAPDTTLIFEQPELHLHPKVQSLLADFFLSMTRLGKQCILETHSEYLVNRIRFRTAAAVRSNPWLEAVKLYFVERGTDGSSFREVAMNEYGAIQDWPDGFFDQSQREAERILRAAMAKKRSNRKGGRTNG